MTFSRPTIRVRQVDEPNRGAPLSPAKSLHCGTYSWTSGIFPRQKNAPIQHERYMRLVRELPCGFCGVEGYTQFCHGDQGKGMAIKADVRTGWPGCGPRTGVPGCHHLIGTAGTFDKDERRQVEELLARRTRDRIHQLGLWPANLPRWPADELES